MGHRNICCDGCNQEEFYGRRYRCLRCTNYDLCGDCYDQHVETLEHTMEHPMQLILEHRDQLSEIFLGGILDLIHLPNCYTCPYCGIIGQTAKNLINHVIMLHRDSDRFVVCPMCACLPGSELVVIRNLARHLLLNHIEQANQLNPSTPPLRFPSESTSRRRRRQVLASSNSQDSNLNTQLGIDVLFELTGPHQAAPDGYQAQAETIFEEDSQIRCANQTLSPQNMRVSLRTLEHLTNSMLRSPLSSKHPDADKYLLLQWIAQEEHELDTKTTTTCKRMQHGVFTEHLLISMLCDNELYLLKNETSALSLPQPRCANQLHLQTKDEKPTTSVSLPDQRHNQIMNLTQPHFSWTQDLDRQLHTSSMIMPLMSLPRLVAWRSQLQLLPQFIIKLQDATLDESDLNGDVVEEEID